jgi:flagellin
MRELAVQGANDTNVSADRAAINKEISALRDEITRIGESTEYNTMKLFTEDFASSDKFLQVGANKNSDDTSIEDGEQVIKLKMVKIADNQIATAGDDSEEADLAFVDDLSSESVNADYQEAIFNIDQAIKVVSSGRSDLGAIQNRLEHTIANADNTAENLQAAESRIRDVNMADEMVKYSKSSILQQAGQSMLAQANQQTQGVLSLLR